MKRTFLACAIVVVVFACGILAINPIFADVLYDEGGLIENEALVILGITLLLSLVLLVRRYIKRSGYKFWLFLFFLIFVFIGEEIDWGREYLGFARHRIAGIAFDGVHDILSVSIGIIKVTRDYIMSIGIVDIKSIAILMGVAVVIIPAAYFLIRGLIKNRERIFQFFSKNLRWEPFLFLILGLVLIVVAMVIDDDNLVGFPHKAVVEESLEFIAAISFLFTSLSGLIEVKSLKFKVQS